MSPARGLVERARDDEQMDDPALDPGVYDQVLRDLSRVNAWTFAARPTLAFLDRSARGMKAFRLLDVGFGDGDMLRRIARWSGRRGVAADLVGVDLNPRSEAAARAATSPDLPIAFVTGDYRDVPGRFDFVVSSLVAHHMTDAELDAFIRFMEARAERGWLINDLHRHLLAYHGFPVLARLIGAHPIVREDGRLSIARSFRPREWRAILAAAGVPEGAARVVRHFPLRLCVERTR
ncbi:methyltransferase domain-containing protein [Sphingosinicella sp. CPCC 101087]|uniref:methyltransferase domain-containing protein n=1 Tax=Sphingosinicella sp. CPCC 101087 TaxID=2497754 RepID=UPI001FB15402|nr:methyltransferase domain-containing protein [Sphingosinicella sp. CPCC 101087]